jgi:hypothetical protein
MRGIIEIYQSKMSVINPMGALAKRGVGQKAAPLTSDNLGEHSTLLYGVRP